MKVFLGTSRVAQEKLYTHFGQEIRRVGPRKEKPIARKLVRARLKNETRQVLLEQE